MKNHLSIIASILSARFFQNKPVIVTWQITGNCQAMCKCCDFWRVKDKQDLSLQLIKKTLDELEANGTKILHFTGGEPLLRKDIGKILAYAAEKKFYISLNSNGLLVKKKKNIINRYVDVVKLSLDGNEDTHNFMRGVDCYSKVIEAIKVLKKINKKILITMVVTRKNIDQLENVVDLVKKYNLKVSLQVASDKVLLSDRINQYCVDKKELSLLIEKIIALKKSSKGRYISNSIAAIKRIKNKQKRRCYLLKVGTRINYDGVLEPCSHKRMQGPLFDTKISKSNSFTKIYKRMKLDLDCAYPCWCAARIEANLILSFDLRSILCLFKNKYF